MSTYYFRPMLDGYCARCDREYLAGTTVYLTADGVVHPECEEDSPEELVLVSEVKFIPVPPKAKPKAKSKTTAKPPATAEAAKRQVRGVTSVCRTCWLVHAGPCEEPVRGV